MILLKSDITNNTKHKDKLCYNHTRKQPACGL